MWGSGAHSTKDRKGRLSPEPPDHFCPCVASILPVAAFIGLFPLALSDGVLKASLSKTLVNA